MGSPTDPSWLSQLFRFLAQLQYFSSKPTLADGGYGSLLGDINGNLLVRDVYTQPSGDIFAITPNSGADISGGAGSGPVRAIYIGGAGAGNLDVIGALNNTQASLTGLVAGQFVVGQIRRVMASTGVTGLVGFR